MRDTRRRDAAQARGIILAFDYGLRRIGVAAGNRVTRTATALVALQTSGRQAPWAEIDRIVADWSPETLVVGEPDAASSAALAHRADRFSLALTRRYGLPVARVDEQLTSATARSELTDARRSGQRSRPVRKGQIDCHAARLIAEQFLRSPVT